MAAGFKCWCFKAVYACSVCKGVRGKTCNQCKGTGYHCADHGGSWQSKTHAW